VRLDSDRPGRGDGGKHGEVAGHKGRVHTAVRSESPYGKPVPTADDDDLAVGLHGERRGHNREFAAGPEGCVQRSIRVVAGEYVRTTAAQREDLVPLQGNPQGLGARADLERRMTE